MIWQKARFAKMREFPTQHSKTLKTKKALPSQAHKKSPPPFTQIFYRLSKKNKSAEFPTDIIYILRFIHLVVCPCEALPFVSFRATHFMSLRAQRGNRRERTPHYKTHARYFCTRVEKRSTRAKEWALSLAITWFQKRSYRGPRGILCTRGEKEHTSKRVSIIACDNVISKAKCATCGRGFAHSCKSSLRSPNADNATYTLNAGGRGCSALFVLFIFFITLQSFLLNKHAARRHVTNCSFDQTIAVNVICLSFACLFLFPTSTIVSCGGALMQTAAERRRKASGFLPQAIGGIKK